MPDPKQIPAPMRLTAVVMRAGDYEATVSRNRIAIAHIGPRGGRSPLFDVDQPEADVILGLVAAGRETLNEMER